MESWVSFLADHGFNGVVAAAVANILAIWKDRIDYRLEYTTGNPDLDLCLRLAGLEERRPDRTRHNTQAAWKACGVNCSRK